MKSMHQCLSTIDLGVVAFKTSVQWNAPGHRFKRGHEWWKLSAEGYPGLYAPSAAKIGEVIDRLVKPWGWLCGFVPVTCPHSVLYYRFAVIWPKFT